MLIGADTKPKYAHMVYPNVRDATKAFFCNWLHVKILLKINALRHDLNGKECCEFLIYENYFQNPKEILG
jgi:hypothetical protein